MVYEGFASPANNLFKLYKFIGTGQVRGDFMPASLDFLPHIDHTHFRVDKTLSKQNSLASGLAVLDEFLGGGLPVGGLCEMGMPCGREGRLLLCRFLSQATQNKSLSLWINGLPDMEVYPPAWHGRGVDLQYLLFATSTHPLQQLKQVFLSSLFRVIVIDAPQHLSVEECAFLHHQAMQYQQVIVVVRPFFLSNSKGNIWMRIRVNIDQMSYTKQIKISAIKGVRQKQLLLTVKELE